MNFVAEEVAGLKLRKFRFYSDRAHCSSTHGSAHEIFVLIALAISDDSDEIAQLHSLVKAFAARNHKFSM